MYRTIEEKKEKYWFLNEKWILNVENGNDNIQLSFESEDDLLKFLNGELSSSHGRMQEECNPVSVKKEIYYDIVEHY